jgi:SAM-dependent methyltransferase
LIGASANIAKKRPNFRFRHVNVFNNCTTRRIAARGILLFPYSDDAFDFVFLASVFTHLHGAEVRHYLDEIARVLRPGGRAVVTVFLLTEESRGLIASGHASQALKHPCGDGFVTDPTMPEGAVGFEADAVFGWVADRGLRTAAFYPGSWSGRTAAGLSYQDVLILEAGPKPDVFGPRRMDPPPVTLVEFFALSLPEREGLSADGPFL